MVTRKKRLKIPKGKSQAVIQRRQTPHWPTEKGQKHEQLSTEETKDVSFCTKTLFSGGKFVVKKSTALQLYYRHIGRRYRRYQRGNQNPHIEEEQTTQWSKEKVQKDKQRSTKHAHKAKD